MNANILYLGIILCAPFFGCFRLYLFRLNQMLQTHVYDKLWVKTTLYALNMGRMFRMFKDFLELCTDNIIFVTSNITRRCTRKWNKKLYKKRPVITHRCKVIYDAIFGNTKSRSTKKNLAKQLNLLVLSSRHLNACIVSNSSAFRAQRNPLYKTDENNILLKAISSQIW